MGKVNTTLLWDKWKQSIAAGQLQNDFLRKQAELHPEMKNSIFAMTGMYWFELVGIEKRYDEMSEQEVCKVYEKAVFLVEKSEYIQVFQCRKCGHITYWIDSDHLCGTSHWDLVFAKAKCHTLETYAGYGSMHDLEKLSLDICERCYDEMKNSSFEQ